MSTQAGLEPTFQASLLNLSKGRSVGKDIGWGYRGANEAREGGVRVWCGVSITWVMDVLFVFVLSQKIWRTFSPQKTSGKRESKKHNICAKRGGYSRKTQKRTSDDNKEKN